MLVRMRWFTLGVLTSLGAVAYVVNELRKVRERMTPRNAARHAGRGVASLLDATAERLSPAGRDR